jgi:hypothetical protein
MADLAIAIAYFCHRRFPAVEPDQAIWRHVIPREGGDLLTWDRFIGW